MNKIFPNENLLLQKYSKIICVMNWIEKFHLKCREEVIGGRTYQS